MALNPKRQIVRETPRRARGWWHVEEGCMLVLRYVWSGSSDAAWIEQAGGHKPGDAADDSLFRDYIVHGKGYHLFIPGIHDLVGLVPIRPYQDVAPIPLELTVARGQVVNLQFRFQIVVGETNWRTYTVPLVQARRFRKFDDQVAQAVSEGKDRIVVLDERQPIDPRQPYRTTDQSVIRAAVLPDDIQVEAEKALKAALTEAAMGLRCDEVEPGDFTAWLNRAPSRRPGHNPFVNLMQATNLAELMHQVSVGANTTLGKFGLTLYDAHYAGLLISEALKRGAELKAIAKDSADAAVETARGLEAALGATKMKPPEGGAIGDLPAYAYVVGELIKSADAHAGVVRQSSPLVQVSTGSQKPEAPSGGGGKKAAPGGKAGKGGSRK